MPDVTLNIVSLDAVQHSELNSELQKLRSPDAGTRSSAVPTVARMGAAAVPDLAGLMASPDKGVAQAARQALQRLAHHSARPGAPQEARRVSAALLKVAGEPRPVLVRSEALDLLGFIGGDEAVEPLARLLSDKEVRDEARMALERIPGPRAQRALQQALERAPEEFRPSLRQSLFNRGQTPATVGTRPLR